MPFADAYFALTDHFKGPGAPDTYEFLDALTSSYPIACACYAVFEQSATTLRVKDFIGIDETGITLGSNRNTMGSIGLAGAFLQSLAPTEISQDAFWRGFNLLSGRNNRPDQATTSGGNGLVFPLPGLGAERTIFSVLYRSANETTVTARRLIRDLPSLAAYFHSARVNDRILVRRQKVSPIHLTNREREILEWVAAGKGYWEIATILGISQRTVRHFMASNRSKLDSVTNKQAVARAVYSGLIQPEITGSRA